MICVSGGERIALGAGVVVSVFPSLHSSLWTGSHAAGAGQACIGDLGVTWHEREIRMKGLGAQLAGRLDRSAIEHLIGGGVRPQRPGRRRSPHLSLRDAGRVLAVPRHFRPLGRHSRTLQPDSPSSPPPAGPRWTANPCKFLWLILWWTRPGSAARGLCWVTTTTGSRAFLPPSTLHPSAQPSRNMPPNRTAGARLPGCVARLRRVRWLIVRNQRGASLDYDALVGRAAVS